MTSRSGNYSNAATAGGAPGGTQAAADYFSYSAAMPPPPPRHRMQTSQNPEDIIAGRYLQRLGNTFVRGASKTQGPQLDDSLSELAATLRPRSGSRRTSVMLRSEGVRKAMAAIEHGAISAAATGALNAGQAEERISDDSGTAAANRRWRERAGPHGDTVGAADATSTPGHTALPPARVAADGTQASVSATSRRRGSAQRRRHQGSPPSRAGSAGDRGSRTPLSRERGHKTSARARSSSPASRPSSALGSAGGIALKSDTGGVFDRDSGLAGHSTSQRRPVVRSVAGKAAADSADAVVAQANRIMTSAAPPPRIVRTELQRAAQVLTQEHSKLLLLVGRRANVQTDIDDLLELADAAAAKAQHERIEAMASSLGKQTAASRERSPAVAGGAARPSSALDAAAVRRQVGKLGASFLRGASSDLNPTKLRSLMRELEEQLDMVEEVLEDELIEPELDNHARALAAAQRGIVDKLSPTARDGGAANAALLPKSLRQRVEDSKRDHTDKLEMSSNFTRMGWLMESVDTELVTEAPEPLNLGGSRGDPFATSLRSQSDANDVAAQGAARWLFRRGSAVPGADNGAAASPVRRTTGQPGAVGSSHRPSQTSDSALLATRETGRHETATHSPHYRQSIETVSEPSLVPFSLTDGPPASGGDAGVVSRPSTQAAPPLSARASSRDSTKRSAAWSALAALNNPLNLPNFMSELVVQYELERLEAARQQATGPPMSASASRRDQNSASQTRYRERAAREESGGSAGGADGGAGDAVTVSSAGWRSVGGGAGRVGSAQHHSATGSRPGSGWPPRPSTGEGFADYGSSNDEEAYARWSHHGSGSTAHTASRRRSRVMLGAQLRNLRDGLLHDLHELYTLHDYIHHIADRREELTAGTAKREADYAAEMEQKLAGHRAQFEAAQRAREEAARNNADAAALSQQFGSGGGGGTSISHRASSGKQRPTHSAGSQRTMVSEVVRPGSVHAADQATSEELEMPPHPSIRPSTAVRPGTAIGEEVKRGDDVAEAAAAAAPAAGGGGGAADGELTSDWQRDQSLAETEVFREGLPGEGLVFTIVGLSAASAPGKAVPKKKKGGKSPGSGSGAGRYLYYELRVECPVATPAAAGDGAAAAAAPPQRPPVSAMVQVWTRRLVNLKMLPTAGTKAVEVAKGSVVSALVTPGAPPRAVLTLNPAKPNKASSYHQALTFRAAGAVDGDAAGPPTPTQDAWETGSNALAVFALPGTDGRRPGSHSSSLDSSNVRPTRAAVPAAATTAAASPAGGATSGALAGSPRPGQAEPKEKARPPAAAAAAAKKKKPLQPQPTAPVKPGPPVEAAPRVASASPDKPEEGTVPGENPDLLSPSPPMSAVPRSLAEWGVPHEVPEMEAVEKNAVVLTVLQTSTSRSQGAGATFSSREAAAQVVASLTAAELAAVRAASAGSRRDLAASDTGSTAVEQLLSAIPDNEVLAAFVQQHTPNSRLSSARLDRSGLGSASVRRVVGVEAASPAGSAATASPRGASDGAPDASALAPEAAAAAAAAEAAAAADPATAAAADPATAAAAEAAAAAAAAEAETPAVSLELPPALASQSPPHSPPHSAEHPPPAAASPAASLVSVPQALEAMAEEILRQVLEADADDGADVPQMDDGLVSVFGASRGGTPEPPQQVPTAVAAPQPGHAAVTSKKSFLPPVPRPGMSPAPTLAISSGHSRPLRAADVEQFGSGNIRFDCDPETEGQATPAQGAGDGATARRPLDKKPPSRFGAAKQEHLSAAATSSGAPESSGRTTTTKQPYDGLATDTAAAANRYVPPPPVVVVKGGGSTKAHMMLPPEAAAALLGPSLRDRARGPAAPQVPGSQSTPGASPGSESPNATQGRQPGEMAPLTQSHTAAAHSVLPATGAAAEAAADPKTVSHVQRFLKAVMGAGGGAHEATKTPSAANQRQQRGAGPRGTGAASVRTELDELQDEARELFMMDPLRYDTVITELMEQAARALNPDFERVSATAMSHQGGDSPSSRFGVSPEHRGPLPPVGNAGSSRTPVGGEAGHREGQPLRASFDAPSALVQFDDGAITHGDDGGAGVRVSRVRLSSSIPQKRGSRVPGSEGPGVDVPPLSPGVVAGLHASGTEDDEGIEDAERRRAFLAALPPEQRTAAYLHVLKAGGAGQATDGSRGDAAAEVERILYEQMKAQLLLRSVIAKMKELWQTKKQDTEALQRERQAQQRQRVMQRALAAVWPLERQRVIHLHKLIHLLDRQVGRVHGWLPHYSDSNVLMEASSVAHATHRLATSTGVPRAGFSSTAHLPMASWYGQRELPELEPIGDGCPRYLHYLPQRRMHRFMRLAKARRMLPLHLVRADIHASHNQHLLLGYHKVALEAEGGGAAPTRQMDSWPQRRLPRRHQARATAEPFRPDRYEDMETRGEQQRYLRRLQRTAIFQGVSKKCSPRMRREADLPLSLH